MGKHSLGSFDMKWFNGGGKACPGVLGKSKGSIHFLGKRKIDWNFGGSQPVPKAE